MISNKDYKLLKTFDYIDKNKQKKISLYMKNKLKKLSQLKGGNPQNLTHIKSVPWKIYNSDFYIKYNNKTRKVRKVSKTNNKIENIELYPYINQKYITQNNIESVSKEDIEKVAPWDLYDEDFYVYYKKILRKVKKKIYKKDIDPHIKEDSNSNSDMSIYNNYTSTTNDNNINSNLNSDNTNKYDKILGLQFYNLEDIEEYKINFNQKKTKKIIIKLEEYALIQHVKTNLKTQNELRSLYNQEELDRKERINRFHIKENEIKKNLKKYSNKIINLSSDDFLEQAFSNKEIEIKDSLNSTMTYYNYLIRKLISILENNNNKGKILSGGKSGAVIIQLGNKEIIKFSYGSYKYITNNESNRKPLYKYKKNNKILYNSGYSYIRAVREIYLSKKLNEIYEEKINSLHDKNIQNRNYKISKIKLSPEIKLIGFLKNVEIEIKNNSAVENEVDIKLKIKNNKPNTNSYLPFAVTSKIDGKRLLDFNENDLEDDKLKIGILNELLYTMKEFKEALISKEGKYIGCHRDMHPGNIFIEIKKNKSNINYQDITARLIDFDLSITDKKELTVNTSCDRKNLSMISPLQNTIRTTKNWLKKYSKSFFNKYNNKKIDIFKNDNDLYQFISIYDKLLNMMNDNLHKRVLSDIKKNCIEIVSLNNNKNKQKNIEFIKEMKARLENYIKLINQPQNVIDNLKNNQKNKQTLVYDYQVILNKKIANIYPFYMNNKLYNNNISNITTNNSINSKINIRIFPEFTSFILPLPYKK